LIQTRNVKAELLRRHVERLVKCSLCPNMASAPVTGGPVASQIMLVGQAPGGREPALGKPFAWTAGKTLFKWFSEGCGVAEDQVRAGIYFAAVCRCFPGKLPLGGDRVPADAEVSNCSRWMDAEIEILRPKLIIPVGKLAIGQFLEEAPLKETIGRMFPMERHGVRFDLAPLPHPSGASPWHRMEPGRTLLRQALAGILAHAGFRALAASGRGGGGQD